MGGRILSTWSWRPVRLISTPRSRIPLTAALASAGAGVSPSSLERKGTPVKKPPPARRADRGVLVAERGQTLVQPRADAPRVLHEALLRDDLEHRVPHRAGDRVAAKRVEVHGPGREPVDQVRAGDDARQRMAVAERLAEGHEVRHRAS